MGRTSDSQRIGTFADVMRPGAARPIKLRSGGRGRPARNATMPSRGSDVGRVMANRKGLCWMCGRPGPLTEEHAFPDWVRRIFAADGNDIVLSDHRAGMVERSRTWTNKSGEVTVRSVCRGCNQGWMSKLEARCQPVLQPLITGHQARLQGASQIDLALWAVKTAWVFQSMNPLTSTCTAEQRYALATALTVPAGVQVVLGAFKETGDHVLCTNWYKAGSTAAQERPDTSASTLVIGRVAFRVIQRSATAAQPRLFTRHHADPSAVHHILPGTSQTVDWPPVRVLGEGDLNEFVSLPEFSAPAWEALPQIPRPQDSSPGAPERHRRW